MAKSDGSSEKNKENPDCPGRYYDFEDVFPEECCGSPDDCPEAIVGACDKDKGEEDG
jgi:hypothetical protein